ncbi:acyl-CoA dehydrogenase family protein [Sorangium sp. So ce1036]|uniref:acyl-CoA dehydrogenase family protein n=1 Tax=Sorangium sp. So ce1036 TaxID=3133328 RepID=UPI003F0EB307
MMGKEKMMSSTRGYMSASDILASTREIVPLLRQLGDRTEATRRLPNEVVDALTKAGVFRLVMPKAWGGPEVDPVTQIQVIENIALGDASAAWCSMILSGSGFYASYLEESVAKELFGRLDVRAAGSLKWTGTAEKVAGGYRVTGRWDFGSGAHHADFMAAGCQVTENGSPVLTEHNMPKIMWVLIPGSELTIEDTWYTTGLRGTGSDPYTTKDLFVPEEHAFNFMECKRSEPLYRYTSLSLYRMVGVQLGIGRRAIEVVHDLVREKKVLLTGSSLGDEQWVQMAIAQAEAILGSAKSYVNDVVGDLWNTLQAGDMPSLEQRAKGVLMIAHAADSARRVMDKMCDVAGSSSIFPSSPLERLRRDLITANTHFLCQQRQYASIGQALLGIEPAFPYF